MAVTDYNVGSNHTLPTLGSAKFSSGLNLMNFIKKLAILIFQKKVLKKLEKRDTSCKL